MLVQIYEVTSPDEASVLAKIGVDHIGVLVGEGEFPREQPVEAAKRIFSTIPHSCRGSALSLSSNLNAIEGIIATLAPTILHLGASTDLLLPLHVLQLKRKYERLLVQRSIPVTDEGSISIARSYDGIADMLLLDSHLPGDAQIGALGITHSWLWTEKS
jgi:phosphoribosylanthranilate isomerase